MADSKERLFLVRALLVIAGILIFVGSAAFTCLLIFLQFTLALESLTIGCGLGTVAAAIAAFVHSPNARLSAEATPTGVSVNLEKNDFGGELSPVRARLAGFRPHTLDRSNSGSSNSGEADASGATPDEDGL